MINTFMEPVLRRRYARVFLEIAGEGGLLAEAETVADLLGGEVGMMAQQMLGLNDDIARYPLAGSDARC